MEPEPGAMDASTAKAIAKTPNDDLVVRGAGILAKVLGIVVPPAGAAADIVIEEIRRRRSDRFSTRVTLMFEHMGRRITALEEDGGGDEGPVELIDEIIAQAVSDEDEEKMQYYVGLVDYVLAAKPNPYQVRILNNALRQMAYLDIHAFLHFDKYNKLPPDLPDMLKDSFWNRIEPLGLFKGGGVKDRNNLTQFGRELLRVCVVPGRVNL